MKKCLTYVFILSFSVIVFSYSYGSEFLIQKNLKFSKNAHQKLLKILSKIDAENEQKKGNFNEQMLELKNFIKKYPDTTSALTAKFKVALLIRDGAIFGFDVYDKAPLYKEILLEITQEHKNSWQGVWAQSAFCRRSTYQYEEQIKCEQTLFPKLLEMERNQDQEFVVLKNSFPDAKGESIVANMRVYHANIYAGHGKYDNASKICREIIKDFPGSKSAKKAKEYLKWIDKEVKAKKTGKK